tara:strand:+ start:524 stop:1048 length:525 start_codon:yes stop_codon:yes gene_type:complete
MANIITYPPITAVAGKNVMIVSDTSLEGNPTRSVSVDALGTYIGSTQTLGYTSYVARVTDFTAEGGVPTVIEFGNTVGNIVWSWVSTGEWKGVLTGAFTANKTVIFAQSLVYLNPSIGANGVNGVTDVNEFPTSLITTVADTSTVNITQYSIGNTGASGKSNTLTCDIEIRVYL